MTMLDVGRVVDLEPAWDHTRCHAGTCARGVTCPNCKKFTWPDSTLGRWDAEHGRTALPYEPVWVRLACGCTFGDKAAASPATTHRPETTTDAREANPHG